MSENHVAVRRGRPSQYAPCARAALPAAAVILAEITRRAPQRTVLAVHENGGDGAGGSLVVLERIAHAGQLLAHPGWGLAVEGEPPGERLMLAERVAHLVARDVGSLRRLLHRHAELDHVEEELQQVLILGIAALHGENQVR